MFLAQKKQLAAAYQKKQAPMLEGPMASISVKKNYSSLDLEKVKHLLEQSFGKKLVPGYFEEPVKHVIVDDEYKGIAIVKTVDGIPYLDKFAVDPDLQGNGIGKKLWAELKKVCPGFAWRASVNNPINGWYEKNSGGSETRGKWKIFWHNIEAEKVPLDRISEKPETLLSRIH